MKKLLFYCWTFMCITIPIESQVINMHTPDLRDYPGKGFVVRETSPYDWVQTEAYDKPLPKSNDHITMEMAVNEYEHTSLIIGTYRVSGHVSLRADIPGITDVNPEAVIFREVRHLTPMWEAGYYGFVNWSRVAMPELLKPFPDTRYSFFNEQFHVWLTVNSRGIAPGTYTGEIIAKISDPKIVFARPGESLEDTTVTIHVNVKVWPIILPLKTRLIATNWKYVPGPPELAEPFAEKMQEYYMNYAYIEPPAINSKTGEFALDKWDWDERAKIMAAHNLNPIVFGVFPFEVDYQWWKENVMSFQGASPDTILPEIRSKEEMINYFRFLAETLKSYGHTHIIINPYDEPRASKREEMMRSFQLAKSAYPGYTNMVGYNEGLLSGENGNSVLKDIAPWADTWCSTRSGQVSNVWEVDRRITGNYPRYLLYKQWQENGNTIWYYHNSWRACDRPGVTLGWCRADGYYIWRYGLDGYSTPDGTIDAKHANDTFRASRKPFSVPVESQPMYRTLFADKDEEGQWNVCASKRLEAYRDGITDHMYLSLLENLTHQAVASSDTRVREAGQEAQVTLSRCYESIRRNLNNWENYNDQKRHLARMILALQKFGIKPLLNEDGTLPRIHSLAFEQYVHKPQQDLQLEYSSNNLVQDGSFEKTGPGFEGWELRAGEKSVPGAKSISEIMISAELYSDGQYSVRMKSPEPDAYMEGWVNTEMISSPIKLETNEIIEASVAVNITTPIRDTNRGAVFNILGYTQTGQEIASWGPGMVESHQSEETMGWKTLAIQAKLEDPRLHYVRLRLGLAGKGQCYFDELTLRSLKPNK